MLNLRRKAKEKEIRSTGRRVRNQRRVLTDLRKNQIKTWMMMNISLKRKPEKDTLKIMMNLFYSFLVNRIAL
jgi:hypothetical protein